MMKSYRFTKNVDGIVAIINGVKNGYSEEKLQVDGTADKVGKTISITHLKTGVQFSIPLEAIEQQLKIMFEVK